MFAPAAAGSLGLTDPLVAPLPGPRVAKGVIASAHVARRGRFDVLVYEDGLVLAKAGRGRGRLARLAHLSPGQAAGLHPKNRIIAGGSITDLDVWERWSGGEVTVRTADGTRLAFSWLSPLNRGLDVSALLTDAMPTKFDLAVPTTARRVTRVVVPPVAAILAVVALKIAFGLLFHQGPPPPPPPPPTTTLPPNVRQARAQLGQVCPAWTALAEGVPPGSRPDPGALRPVVDGMRSAFDAAAGSDPKLAPAVAELVWLQEYARRPAPEAELESVARIGFAMRQVGGACSQGR